jgi:hypothetical protein
MMALLAGCGSGSGGDASTRTEISTNAMTFNAVVTDTAAPTAQVFTATFGSDIAHLGVVHSGGAVSGVTSIVNGRTATITVTPVAPADVGPGPFVGAVAVTGYTCADATCSKLAAGTTSTVSINYQISPIVQLVTPYVATAGVADEVVIRGIGFTSFTPQGVRFGDVAATAYGIPAGSTTEIRATHPALPAGTYTVRLVTTNHQGDIPSTATLVVVDPTAYAATTLAYPTAPGGVVRLSYDAERRAVLAVTDVGSIVRYAYNGTTWGAATEVAAGLRDVTLSATGTSLYGITSAAFVPVDPVTLALGTAVAAPSLTANSFLKNIVVGNDDVALITTGISASTPTAAYLFFPLTNSFLTGNLLNNATPAMAANGTGAYLIQGDPSLTADVAAAKYTTSNNSISTAITSLRQNAIPPAISRTGNRLVLNGTRVYDGSEALLGTLSATTAAVVLKPDGSRAYVYDPAAGGILVYDVSVDRDEAAYVALGAVVPLAGDPGSNPQMTISPDGGTLFLAGSARIVVQPTPAL